MAPVDGNSRSSYTVRRSWGRFGEPEQPNSPQVHSLKLPKRRGSFDGDSSDDEEAPGSSCCSPNFMQSAKHTRPLRRTSLESSNDDFEDDDDYLCMRAATQHQQQAPALQLSETPSRRRASTGTNPVARTRPLLDDSDAPQKPRRCSLSGPRPCMESTISSVRDAPVRRSSLGGTRPCMANSFCVGDRPILRPYRQLSSNDLFVDSHMGCIGEETDEDLMSGRSNRSCLLHGDSSNRSNRSYFVHDFSNRSNRSNIVKQLSNRSLVNDTSNRSNRSAFQTSLEEAKGVSTALPIHEEEPSESSSSSLLPASPPERSESWPIRKSMDERVDSTIVSSSKTWPTNLMGLLALKQLSLENLDDSDQESDDRYNAEIYPRGKQINRGLLGTIDKASELIRER